MKYKIVNIEASHVADGEVEYQDKILQSALSQMGGNFKTVAAINVEAIEHIIADTTNNTISIYVKSGECIVADGTLDEFISSKVFEI